MRILMIGDIVGRPGRRAVAALTPRLRQELGADVVIANGENAAGGFGLTAGTAEEILKSGVDLITTGNHVWDQKDLVEHLTQNPDVPIIRPLNYPPGVPGRGSARVVTGGGIALTVVNLMGTVHMVDLDNPFRAADALLASSGISLPIFVDFHAEATSEKMAMGWYLDGRVSAVVGTHTHVATADARILPRGTAFVTDVGMVGPRDSIIGMEPESILRRFTLKMPVRFTVPEGGAIMFSAVVIDVDPVSGMATAIERIDRTWESK